MITESLCNNIQFPGSKMRNPFKIVPIIRYWITTHGLAIIFLLCSVTASANGYPQLTLSVKNVSITKVLKELKRQSGYDFVYSSELIQRAGLVTVELHNVSLETALNQCFKDKPLSYSVVGKTVVIKSKNEPEKTSPGVTAPLPVELKGRVVTENGTPVAGASVKIAGTKTGTAADDNGFFQLEAETGNVTLMISATNIEPVEIKTGQYPRTAEGLLLITAQSKLNMLDESVVIGYGTTTRRLSTGSISKMKGEDIRKQPVENPMLALGGRLPGLQISQTSGMSGAPVSVNIRGKSTLGAGPEPLYIVDGVPFAHSLSNVTFGSGVQAQMLGGLTSATTGTSPFVSINPADIESIEVLKDADATAIYGSRGANGVILITTRKAKAGKTSVDASFYTGWGRPTRTPQMLNTQQYVMMRNEAFKNDNIVPNTTNATDLTVWDTTRYTDWTKLLMGETARSYDAQVRLSGGSKQTQFSLSTGFHRETPIYYGYMNNDRLNLHANISHRSNDNKFAVALSTGYNVDNNNINTTNMGQLVTTLPNAPYPLDSTGNLVWRDEGINFTNPLSYLKKEYKGLTENSLTNLNLSYRFSKNFQVKVDGGINIVRLDQRTANPTTSQSPYSGTPAATAEFFNQVQRNWIVEPQAEYTKQWGKGKLQVLAGGSFQQQLSEGQRINASGYTSDELLETPGPAATKSVTSSYAKYRYNAIFGRVSYNWEDKYLVNVSGRRDGSSRFGPGKQFGNFGAAGLGWVFSEENFMKGISFINFAKIRTSFGVTGNDRIGNYQYIARWSSTTSGIPYQNASGLYPVNLENPDFGWERNKKWEAALELSILNNRIFVSADYYMNRTDNQLIGYNLPSQTGFTSITANRDALVENRGWEFVINSVNFKTKDWTWKSGFNITIPRNELKAYPNIETSSYASTLVIGQPVTIRKFIDYQGIDPETGVIKLNGINLTTDRTIIRDLAQRHYGGLLNTVTYKGWSLDVFFHFVKQAGLTAISFSAPGARTNQTVEVLNRWQEKGDITDIQKFATTGTPVTQYSYYANFSDARVADASFVRLKNVSLSYQFERKWIEKLKAENIRLYFQGQNLLTFTNYKIGDPETFSFTDTPLRMLTMGCQVIF